RLLLDTLQHVSSGVTVAVRLHPREHTAPDLECPPGRLRVVLDRTPDARDAVMASDLVVGMNSALLLEACYLGAAVLSLQPGLRGPDILPSNRWGVSAVAHCVEAAQRAIRVLVADLGVRKRLAARTTALTLDEEATQAVRDCVYRQLALASAAG